MAYFMNIGGVRVNLDNANYVVVHPNNPAALEIHFGNETVTVDKFSPDELAAIFSALESANKREA